MLDIDKKQYSVRKEYEYDDDTAILFYKGIKVARAMAESFRKSWIEEDDYFNNLYNFLDDVGANTDIELDEEDEKTNWETIWEKLSWDKETKSYKYKNLEWVILDI